MFKRTRILAECLVREARTLPFRRSALDSLRRQRASRNAVDALVLGNGPSVKNLDWSAVRKAQRDGLELIVVNWFPVSSAGKNAEPQILVLSDPTMRPGSDADPRNVELWAYVHDHPSLRLAVPTSWFPALRNTPDIFNRTWFFDDASLEGWNFNTSPLWPRGYLSLTVYKALGLATFLGYHKINILGIDNTMFHGLKVNEDNQISLGDHHFYRVARPEQDLTWFCPNGVADYFYDLSLCFLHLRRCFGDDTKIFNLDTNSLVDCFPKTSTSELISLSPPMDVMREP